MTTDRSSDAALVVLFATVAIGAAIVVAQALQGPVTLAIVAIASVVWFASPIVALVRVCRARIGRGLPNVVTIVGMSVAAVGAVHLALLGLVRILGGHPALVWNVDYRFHLTHSEAIARSADLGSALDYLGAGIDYHVGPAWIAGSIEHFLGWGVTEVSFVAVPLMTAIVTVAGGAVLCSRLGADPRAAVVAPGVLLVVPALLADGFRILEFPYLRDSSMFEFSASYILNGQFGWALGIASVALLATTRLRLMLCGALGLAAVVVAKPQYFVGFMVVAVAVSIVVAFDRGARPNLWRRYVVVLGVTVGVAGLFLLTAHGASNLVGSPRFRPFDTGLALEQFRGIALLLLVVVVATALLMRTARALPLLRAAILIGVLGIMMIAVFTIVQVPFRAESLARARSVGLDWSVSVQHANVAQSVVPVGIVLALLSLAGLSTLVLRSGRRGAVATVAVACVAALAPIPLMVTAARFPTGRYAYEAVEDVPLAELLATVPETGSVLMVSDMADPAEDYGRSLRNFILTSFGAHQFVASSLAYGNVYEPDAKQRLRAIQRFFGSAEWTPWHTRFVERFGVTHVLVNARCRPNWVEWPEELDVVSSAGDWTLAKVRGGAGAGVESAAADREWRPITARFGRASCLDGS